MRLPATTSCLVLATVAGSGVAQTLGTSLPVVGRSLTIDFDSTPGHSYVTNANAPPLVSIQVPGVAGTLRLNPLGLIPLFSGTVPATGTESWNLPIPNDPTLVGGQLAIQALDVLLPSSLALSNTIELELRAEPQRPNVVVIMADDLGYGTPSCYGGTALSTPHIDSIATNGVRFTAGYVSAPMCSPARASMLTGRYAQRYGFEYNVGDVIRSINNPIGLDPAQETLADMVGRAGYATSMVGKWHLGVQPQYRPHGRGFQEFFGFLPGATCYWDCESRQDPIENSIFREDTPVVETEYLTDAFAREAVAFIDRNATQPFFLFAPFNAVHTPLEATSEHLARFAHVADDDTRYYLAMTSALDDAVGEILDALRRNSLEQDTLVVFLSDNGGVVQFHDKMGANGPLRLGKFALFEGGVRVPFIVQWPRVLDGGAVYSEAVSAFDLVPTILNATGTQPPGVALDGVDLVPHLTGHRNEPPHEFLYWRNGDARAIRSRKWKLIQSAPDSTWLYDLTADIGEVTNLASQQPSIVAWLESKLDDWSAGLLPPAWPNGRGGTVIIDGQPYSVSF